MAKQMTNLQHLLNSVDRSQAEPMMVVRNGQKFNEGYIVVNRENSAAYNVGVKNGKITSCTCPHHSFRGVVCKHMVKVSTIYNMDIATLTVATQDAPQRDLEKAI